MRDKVQSFAGRYGWGVVVAALPYINIAILATGAATVVMLAVVLQFLGVNTNPPEYGGGLFGALIQFLFSICQIWALWTYMMLFALVPTGFAWSLADLVSSKATNRGEQYIGAVAGLAMSGLPLLIYLAAIFQRQ